MSRLSVVGCEASGKTVFTAAVADFFGAGTKTHSCCMIPDNVAAHRFAEYANYQMRMLHEWPRATNPDKTSVMKWSLRIDNSTVADLEMLEFGGEVFRAAFREGEPAETGDVAVRELLKYLSSAEFVVVMISLAELVRDLHMSDVKMSEEELVRHTESRWVSQGLLNFVKKRLPPETGLVIALTQADAYRKELDACGGGAALLAKSWPTVAALYPDVPVLEVSSVSQVTEDGQPAEGYSTAGVLPVMKAFGEYCVGKPEVLRAAIEERREALTNPPEDMDPRHYRRLIQEYEDHVGMFRIVSGLAGDEYVDELLTYVDWIVAEAKSIEEHLRALEHRAAEKWKAQEEKRRKEQEAAERERKEKERLAEEKARKEREEAERRRQEDIKHAADERIKAEKELEKQQLLADVELAKAKAVASKARAKAILIAALGVVLVGGVAFFFVDRGLKREATVIEMTVRETRRQAEAKEAARLREAALAGDVQAAQTLVGMIREGKIAEADVQGLYKVYMVLVPEGDADAMFRLGVACHEGTCGVSRSDVNARCFLLMAKNAGYVSERLDELLAKTAEAGEAGGSQGQDIDKLFAGEEPEKPAEGGL